MNSVEITAVTEVVVEDLAAENVTVAEPSQHVTVETDSTEATDG